MIEAVVYYDGCLDNINLTNSLAIWANREKGWESCSSNIIDARYGYKQNASQLRTALNLSPRYEEIHEVIVTNSLIVYNNQRLKDIVSKSSILTNYYIFDQYGIHSLQDFTDRELRVTHNLEKMYINGAFESYES